MTIENENAEPIKFSISQVIYYFFKSSLTFKSETLQQIIATPNIRTLISIARFKKLSKASLRANKPVFRTLEEMEAVTENTVEHNSDLKRMFYDGLSHRPDLISKPLGALNFVRQNGRYLDVLSIGARTEAEIFSLMSAGLNADRIMAFDLFTYTDKITLGDVTNLQSNDSSFDIVVLGWVLEFVTDIEGAISEIIRVSRNGAYIAIGAMYHPISTDMGIYNRRKEHSDRQWMPKNCHDILSHFGGSVELVIFHSDVEQQDIDKRNDLVVIFKLRKPNEI